jgi:anti-sigma B factor antagonist
VIDLSEVTFLEATGLKVLVPALNACVLGASVRRVMTRPVIRAVFEVTALDSLFEIYASLGEALGR